MTLLGPGGNGKTRLALEAARRFLDDYCDGVFFVELAGLITPDRVPQAVAHALGVENGDTEGIGTHLRERHVLLVLDNCEHQAEACGGLIRALLEHCPRLRVLTTSLEVLGVSGEAVFRIPPLSLPPVGSIGAQELVQYEAVQLFTQRATAVMPDFEVTEQNAQAVLQICMRLDGMPLALELAAARIRLLTAQQIASRLDDRFRLLTTGSRTADERHRTLRAAVEWGYDLLSMREQICFRRLAVFAGGLTLEAAEMVCAGGEIDRSEVADLVSQLLDKSFLQNAAEDGLQRRYHLLETLRAFGLEVLAASGELAAVRRLHCDWCLALAAEAFDHKNAADRALWCDRLEMEHDNLNAALRWSIEAGDTEAFLRLANLLDWFWNARGYFREGRSWVMEVLARCEEPTELRARALDAAGTLAYHTGDFPVALTLFSEALELARTQNNQQDLATALNNVGAVAMVQGDYARACPPLEEAKSLWLALGQMEPAAITSFNLGMLASNHGKHDLAREYLGEAVRIHRAENDLRGVAAALGRLAQVAFYQGDRAEAWDLLREVETLCQQIRDNCVYSSCLYTKGRLLSADRKDLGQAEAVFRECFQLLWELGHRVWLWDPLVGLAELALLRNRPLRAARLLGAAEAILEESGVPVDQVDQPWHDQLVQAVLRSPGEVKAAWMAGRGRFRGELAEIEGEEAHPGEVSRPAPAPSPSAGPGAAVLTPREQEIVQMIAAGSTIKEVSQKLYLSPRTVQKHEENIRTKLGLVNRASVAAWAVRQGLGGE